MNTFLPEIGNGQRMPTLTTSVQPYTESPSKCNRVHTHTHTHMHTHSFIQIEKEEVKLFFILRAHACVHRK